jgi:hypothetical protein
MMEQEQIRPGSAFSLYTNRIAAKGVITKVNRVNVVYASPYFKTSSSPDGWVRGLQISKDALADAEYLGDAEMT